MAQIEGTLDARIVETDEQPFIPGPPGGEAPPAGEGAGAGQRIDIIMHPVTGDGGYGPYPQPSEPTLPGEEPFIPPAAPYTGAPGYDKYGNALPAAPGKSCVLNIETTGLMPFEGRIINISAVNMDSPEKTVTFFSEDEPTMVADFISWFNSLGFTEIIGYNVSFDTRYIFTKCMRYGIVCSAFAAADIYDVMNVMKQVKREFVYGYNKPGTLDEWSYMMFGERPPMKVEDVLKAWEEKRYADIDNYNQWKSTMTMYLWVFIAMANGDMSV